MSDWAEQLCAALDEQEDGLAGACHLSAGMSGEEFEKALGLLLRWKSMRHLNSRFCNLTGDTVRSHDRHFVRHRQRASHRLDIVMRALNTTLYDQFGQDRVDDKRAASAYRALLTELGDPDLICATTNYDRSAEAALDALGRDVDSGFVHRVGRAPVFRPDGLVTRVENQTPFLHLHGAVGWYERDGVVIDHYANLPYNATLGSPVVLYPDPEKDPTSDAIVSQLWHEFYAALDLADHVLLLGHSLHDPALIRALGTAAATKKVAVSYRSDRTLDRIRELLPSAIPMRIEFGPDLDIDRSAVAAFRS
jgi:hypothetical protein